MRLLFDFVTLQLRTGAGEYVRRIFFELAESVKHLNYVELFILFDSLHPVEYEELKPEIICSNYNFKCLDLAKSPINELITTYAIDRFFIGCAQYLGSYPGLTEINCDVVCVIHDLSVEELNFNKVNFFGRMCEWNADRFPIGRKQQLRNLFHLPKKTNFEIWYSQFKKKRTLESDLQRLSNIISLCNRNQRTQIVAVSEYTKTSLIYNFKINPERIKVLYSPERIITKDIEIKNRKLKELIEGGHKYYLLVSAYNPNKNTTKALKAFKRFSEIHNDVHIVTLGFFSEVFENHIDLPILSDEDYFSAIKNCYALIYPSLFEGFGYPPLEAMHFKKPVLCSNMTSMPEIFGDAPIYFSPLYETAIFNALNVLNDANYRSISERSFSQYCKVCNRQETDLQYLVNTILLVK